MQIKKGDIFYADLSPVVGCEQGGIRPVLIVQNNIGNKYSPTVIVAAITGQRCKPDLPTHVPLHHVKGLKYGSIVLLEQIRTIDVLRLQDYIGRLSQKELEMVDESLAISFGMLIENKRAI